MFAEFTHTETNMLVAINPGAVQAISQVGIATRSVLHLASGDKVPVDGAFSDVCERLQRALIEGALAIGMAATRETRQQISDLEKQFCG